MGCGRASSVAVDCEGLGSHVVVVGCSVYVAVFWWQNVVVVVVVVVVGVIEWYS